MVWKPRDRLRGRGVFGYVIRELGLRERTDIYRDRQTDVLITILCTPPEMRAIPTRLVGILGYVS